MTRYVWTFIRKSFQIKRLIRHEELSRWEKGRKFRQSQQSWEPSKPSASDLLTIPPKSSYFLPNYNSLEAIKSSVTNRNFILSLEWSWIIHQKKGKKNFVIKTHKKYKRKCLQNEKKKRLHEMIVKRKSEKILSSALFKELWGTVFL